MISFDTPLLLLLLIPCLFYAAAVRSRLRSVNVLQGVIYLLLVCALAGMRMKLPDKEGILFILCDRSSSMPRGAEKSMTEQIRSIEGQMKKNSPGVMAFAGDSRVEKMPGGERFSGFSGVLTNRESSDGGKALERALELIPHDLPGRILLMTDGRWNGTPPEKAFAKAAMRNIAVDLLPLKRSVGNDFAVTGVSAPSAVGRGESFFINCILYAPYPAEVSCRIRRNKEKGRELRLKLRKGENRFSWREAAGKRSVDRYEVSLHSLPEDPVPENNSGSVLVTVRNGARLLLLSSSPSGNLAELLRRNRFDADVMDPRVQKVTPEMLGNCRGLILENVPASALSPGVNALAAELVREGRMGILMTGGLGSFAMGGWYKTPIGEILPVALEKQNQIRRRSSAVMVALDRSGSMAAAVDGVTKMNMANLAAAESFKLLSPEDEFGLIAVDTDVHQVVPLSRKGKSNVVQDIMSIESAGGGIYVGKALHECLRQLQRSKASVRHLLLFADAADAEEPGAYRELLRRAAKAGITVSVVGLGGPDSSDGELLREIARLGKGRVYFVENASELPRVFAEDTFVMARNVFQRGKVTARYTGQTAALPGAEKLRGTVESMGYNAGFAREKSTVLLQAEDEESTPLVLTGHAGLGRTAACCLEADGEFSGKFASDPGTGALLTALVRFIYSSASEDTGEFLVTRGVSEGRFRAEIHLDPERQKVPFTGTPRLSLLVSQNGKVEKGSSFFRWQGPDTLAAQIPLPSGAVVSAAVLIPGKAPLILAPAVQSVSAEFRRETPFDIPALVLASSGEIRSSFHRIGNMIPRQKREVSCKEALCAAAGVLILLHALLFRKNWEIPQIKLPSFRKIRKKGEKRPAAVPQKKTAAPVEKEVVPSAETDPVSSALKRAKRK